MSFDPAAKRSRFSTDGPSEADILELVSQRESYRQQRNFAQSDQIREQLRSMGVELYDKEKEWRCNDGRRGTLFTAGPGECPFSDLEIQDRIAQREDARKSKDFSRADQLRDELRRVGVELDDKVLEWRTASGRRGTYSGAPAQPRQALGIAAIRKLVAERERLRAHMDFEAADELRRQLAQLGVELFDNERYWKSSDGQRGVIITGGHEVDCFLTDQDIAYRVAQREEARSNKDFGQADLVRDSLRQAGVELIDAQRTWISTDGRQGSYGGSAAPSPAAATGLSAAAAAPNLGALGNIGSLAGNPQVGALLQALGIQAQPEVTVQSGRLPTSAITSNPSTGTFSTASIVAMVSGRERCRDNHDWEGADSIRNDLRAHGVDVWDKDKVWRANDGRNGVIARLT